MSILILTIDSSLQAFKRYICNTRKKGLSIEENQQRNQLFHLLKEQMKKFVALLTKKKGKTATNEWEHDDFG